MECLKDKIFWILYFMCFFSVSKFFSHLAYPLYDLVVGLVTVDCFKTFGFSRPNLDHEGYLTWVVSISCIFNAGRSVWSIWLDHYSYKKVYGALLVL